MGQQQFLLIVAGIIVVALMIAVSIAIFNDQASAANRDAIYNDLMHYATKAQEFIRRPSMLGGGGGSFVGFQLEGTHRNANGTYALNSVSATSVSIQGLGIELGYDTMNPVKLVVEVTTDSIKTVELN